MAVKTCEEVINGANYAGGEGSNGKQVTRDTDVATNSLTATTEEDDGDFLDSVIRAAGKVDAAATSLYQYDCSEHLLEWMYKVCPGLKTVGEGIDSVISAINSISTGVAIGDFVQNNSVTKKICDVVASIFGTVNSWLEMIAKAAFALFDKIDTARERMQSALKALTDAVLQCILDVYDMIEKFLTDALKISLNFDWDSLEGFLRECPCVCRFVAYVTGCDEDADGNNISDQPDRVIFCIRDKFWFIDGLNLATGLSAIMDDYIKQYLVLMFDAISLAIDSLFTLFIYPFRWLIKQYAMFLRKKWDVTFLISPLRTSHLDCLLLYTKEVDDGKTVYTMSILDMMESMKMWVNCLEYPCPALSERIKNKVKKFNEELQLTGEFWNRAFEADIYLCCMRADSAYDAGYSENGDGYTLDELAGMWDDLYDRLRTCNSRAKNKVSVAKVTYGLDGTGGIAWNVDLFRNGQEGKSLTETDPVRDAAEFTDSPDRENDINVGKQPLTSQEDESLRAIGLSIADGCEEDSYFTEKWYQFLRFAGLFKISNNTVKALRDVRGKSSGLDANFNGGFETNFPKPTGRAPVKMDEEERLANYSVESDYEKARVLRIQNIIWTSQRNGESLADYYSRMYATAG